MFMFLLEPFSFAFIQRAMITGCLVGIACAVLGVFLVLRRLSLIGDGLAHITFGSVALALFGGLYGISMVLVSLPIVVLASLGILKLSQTARLGGDAAIGIVSSVGVASGVILSVVGTGYGADLFSYLFGSILAISTGELYVAVVLCLAVLLIVWRYYHDLVALTFNEEIAAASGVSITFLNVLLAILTAFTVVLAMRLVGIMLISSLLILPAAAALQVARSFTMTVILAMGAAVTAVVGGILVSYYLNLPSGATIIMVAFSLFILALGCRRLCRNTIVA